jgi:serine/threonine protein kinase
LFPSDDQPVNASPLAEGPAHFRAILVEAGVVPERIGLEGVPPIWWLRVGEALCVQGWKLHLSSRFDAVPELLAKVVPLLQHRETTFKVAGSIAVARAINGGDAGLSQVGKIVTIYPVGDEDAVDLGNALTDLLRGFSGPVIDNELRLAPDAPVYARYGSFRRVQRTKIGVYISVVEDADGNLVPDLRSLAMHRVLGILNPFPKAVESSLGPLVDGRFLIVGPMAETRHSKVVIGVDVDAGDTCVLKVVKRHAAIGPSGWDATYWLKHEWSVLKALHHTGAVPQPLAFYEDVDRAVLIMERIQGRTLLSYAAARAYDPVRQEELAAVAARLTSLVQEVHAAGFVLGDLTPMNIIVEPNNALRLVDLERASREGAAWSFAFTSGYTAPSLITSRTVSRAHDLYSLAATIYHLVTGTNLAAVPQYDRLLRCGGMLAQPWSQIVGDLLAATPSTAVCVLRDTKEQLEDLANAGAPNDPSSRRNSPHLARPLETADPLDADLPLSTILIADLGCKHCRTCGSRQHGSRSLDQSPSLYAGGAISRPLHG